MQDKLITIELLKNLDIARFEIHLRPRVDAVLPPFLGSTLRGAFGHALKAIVCLMPHGDCARCFLVDRCLYPKIFETSARNSRTQELQQTAPVLATSTLLKRGQDAPRPFIFIPPFPARRNGSMRARDDLLRSRVRVNAGEPVVFGLSLFGDAIQEVPHVIYAISLMAQHGFGAAHVPFVLEKVLELDSQGDRKLIYTEGSNRISARETSPPTLGGLVQARLHQVITHGGSTGNEPASRDPQPAFGNEITLQFITPARLRIKGELIETPSFAQLITSLSLRLSLMAETFSTRPLVYDYRSMIEKARSVKTRVSTLRLIALDRFSNRRSGKLQLDGFMGEITFAGPVIAEFFPTLTAGEFIHIGSATAFGLGRYVISQRGSPTS